MHRETERKYTATNLYNAGIGVKKGDEKLTDASWMGKTLAKNDLVKTVPANFLICLPRPTLLPTEKTNK